MGLEFGRGSCRSYVPRRTVLFRGCLCEGFLRELKILFEWTQINVTNYMKKTGKVVTSSRTESADINISKHDEQIWCHLSQILGHHGDDQIETMLMRMTRGSSGKARAGIPIMRPFENGEIIALVAVNKEEIEVYCWTHNWIQEETPAINQALL